MPLEYRIYPEHHLVLERFSGVVRLDDLIAFTETIWADERYESTMSGLIDLTEASISIRPAEITTLSKFIRASQKASTGRIALLAGKPLETAMSVLLSSKLVNVGNLSVFSTWEGALSYLKLPLSLKDSLRSRT